MWVFIENNINKYNSTERLNNVAPELFAIIRGIYSFRKTIKE